MKMEKKINSVKFIDRVSDESLEFTGVDGKDYVVLGEDWETLEELLIDEAKESLGKEKYNYICEDFQVPDLTGKLIYELDSHLFDHALNWLIYHQEGESFKVTEIPYFSPTEIAKLTRRVETLEEGLATLLLDIELQNEQQNPMHHG